MGDDFIREECTEGRVDGCCERTDKSYKVKIRCHGCVLGCLFYTIMQSSEQHVVEYFFGRTVR